MSQRATADALAARSYLFVPGNRPDRDAVSDTFSPTAADVAWAQRVLDATAAAKGAAAAADGEMVDAPVITKAASILREAQRGIRREDT